MLTGDSRNVIGVYRTGSTMSRLSVTGKFKNACGFTDLHSLIPVGQHVRDTA